MDVADDVLSPGAPMTGASPTVGAVFFGPAHGGRERVGRGPVLLRASPSPRLAALANALACGVMLAASFDLVHEGEPHGPILVVVGVVLRRGVHRAHAESAPGPGGCEVRARPRVRDAKGVGKRFAAWWGRAPPAHPGCLGEGAMGVAASGANAWKTQGTLVTRQRDRARITAGRHGGDRAGGAGRLPGSARAGRWRRRCRSPLAVPAFVFVETFAALLPLGMGFAAGCMIWITVAELLPDAR